MVWGIPIFTHPMWVKNTPFSSHSFCGTCSNITKIRFQKWIKRSPKWQGHIRHWHAGRCQGPGLCDHCVQAERLNVHHGSSGRYSRARAEKQLDGLHMFLRKHGLNLVGSDWNHGILWLSIQLGMENHPNWRTPSFFRGVGRKITNQK